MDGLDWWTQWEPATDTTSPHILRINISSSVAAKKYDFCYKVVSDDGEYEFESCFNIWVRDCSELFNFNLGDGGGVKQKSYSDSSHVIDSLIFE